jgi:formate dehydrogenase alpha subunit
MIASITIDGRHIDVAASVSVLEAAARAGIGIPALCYHPALPPDGSCRLCLVEVSGRPGLHPACLLPADDGLVLHTETPAVGEARRNALRLLLRRYRPGVGRAHNELLALAARYGVPLPAERPPAVVEVDESNPFIRVDRDACIHCWRCVRACDLLNGVAAIGVFGRGEAAHIGFGLDGPMQSSSCEFCGMCEAVCPTDALTLRRAVPVPEPTDGGRPLSVLCSYCGVGCRLTLQVSGPRIVRTDPDWEAPANHGLLCVKGRFGWTYVHHRDRLTRPLVRRALLEGAGADLVEVDWDTALDLVAARLAGIRAESGGQGLGFLASAKCSNEENYLFQKLARQVFGTNNVDHCARLCHAPTVEALSQALGSGAMTNSMDDIVAEARCVLIVGSNTTEQHPVFGMRLRRAVKERGLRIIVADPRRIPIVDVAALHLRLRPGTDIALLNALAHVLIANGWIDGTFVAERTEGFEALAAGVRDDTPECAAAVTGVPAEDIRRAARLLWEHRPGALLFAMGVTQHTCGTANALACTNLQLLLGNLGRRGAGVNPLRGQNNVQGACDMGALPSVLPGYQPVADASVRGRFETAWGTTLPTAPGLTVTEILDAALAGRIRGLYVLGENVAMTDPDLTHVHRCLEACEFLVVQEIFLSETARFAHVVLPAAASVEKTGSFTNTDRRVQLSPAAIPPPGDGRPDWWIIAELGKRLRRATAGAPPGAAHAAWGYAQPAEVMDEIAALTPIYGGITHARLGHAGIQWPCPTPDHPGTPVLHVERASRGPARFVAVSHQPPAESPDARYPLVLTTGRLLEHYHSGTMTRRVPALDWLVPEASVEIHPARRRPAGDRRRDGGAAPHPPGNHHGSRPRDRRHRARERLHALSLRRGRGQRADPRRPGPGRQDPRVQGLRGRRRARGGVDDTPGPLRPTWGDHRTSAPCATPRIAPRSHAYELALTMHRRRRAARHKARRASMVEAVRDQWAIVIAVIVLVGALIVWLYTSR